MPSCPSLCPAFSCQFSKCQQGFAASNWVQLPLWNVTSFGDAQHFFFLAFGFPSNVFLILSLSKNLMEGCKVQLISISAFRKDSFQRSVMVPGCMTFWQLRWSFSYFNEANCFRWKELLDACFVLHSSKVGWCSVLAFQTKSVWYFRRRGEGWNTTLRCYPPPSSSPWCYFSMFILVLKGSVLSL